MFHTHAAYSEAVVVFWDDFEAVASACFPSCAAERVLERKNSPSHMSLWSMNELTTFRWSLDEDIRKYKAAGFEGIGVWRQKVADFGEDRAVDLIAESGLRVTNLLWAGGFTGSDGRSQEECLRDAAEAIRLAAALEAGCLVVYAGGRNNHTRRHAERLLRLAIEQMLDLAAEIDVTLAIEPMHAACAAEWTFLTDLEAASQLVRSYDSPNLKLALDSYHFGQDPQLAAMLPELVPIIGIVHLGDRSEPHSLDQNRCRLGTGRLALPQFIGALWDNGYDGDFDVELFGREIDASQYDDVLRASRRFFDRLSAPVGGG